LISLLALQEVKGIGIKALNDFYDTKLVYEFPDIKSDAKHYKARLSKLIKSDLVDKLLENYSYLVENAYKLKNELDSKGIKFIPQDHYYYPESLKRMKDPPRWIFVQGNLDIVNIKSIIGVVGTRNSSLSGIRLAYLIGQEFARNNFVVLSGFAKGIDYQAHKGAVQGYILAPNFLKMYCKE